MGEVKAAKIRFNHIWPKFLAHKQKQTKKVDYMKYSFMLIGLSALWYLCSRLRRENDREGWVKIRNKTFHDIFFYNGYWEYRPCDIVGAVVSLGCFLAGVVTLILTTKLMKQQRITGTIFTIEENI